MKKLLSFLTILVSFPIMAISFVAYSEAVKAEGLYNAREELEYSPHARMEREEEQSRQIQFQQYQQQQYMQHQRLMDQQSMYDETHRSASELSRVLLKERL
jgi:hypothetical protein